MAPEQIKVYVSVNMKSPKLIRNPVFKYNPLKADVWSLGVCLYRMMFFNHPFVYTADKLTNTLPEMVRQMKRGPKLPKRLSSDCSDMLSALLVYYKNKRITMENVMKHNWLKGCPLLDDVHNVKKFFT